MLGAIAEFERDLIRERTRAGLAAARRRGRHPGRPRALDARARARVHRLLASGHSIRAIAGMLGVSKPVVARELKAAALSLGYRSPNTFERARKNGERGGSAPALPISNELRRGQEALALRNAQLSTEAG